MILNILLIIETFLFLLALTIFLFAKEKKIFIFILIIAFCFSITGGLMNFVAVSSNGGKMPVLLEKEIDLDNLAYYENYFFIHSSEGIENPILIDRIKIRNAYLSFGDITIILGESLMIGLIVIMAYYKGINIIRIRKTGAS